ncbi:MAG: type II secretion system minor pseudopilin GspK [Polaromonas sp.]|nr:type II secretion system minor pseudopilin GspK [Polaromonas sp.]
MLTVALVATMAAAALWQQWRSTEVEAAERARVQALWVLTGALDWSRLILREDGRSGGAAHLGEPWAIPLEEARLSSFLATDKNNTADNPDDLPQTFLSGRISDLQARMNVLNLVDVGSKASGVPPQVDTAVVGISAGGQEPGAALTATVSEPALAAFSRLFERLGLSPGELTALAENLRFALDNGAGSGAASMAPLLPQRVDQLVWLGLSPRSLALLRPHITLLPKRTPVNLNTASAMVLSASIPLLDLAQAQRMVAARLVTPFRTLADAGKLAGEAAGPLNAAQHSVNSRFFEVRGRLRQEQGVVEEHSVVQRDGLNVKTLWRDRGGQAPQEAPLQ